jgi:hypothetical protein
MTSGQVEEPDLPGDAVRVDDLLVVLPAVPPSLHSARAALRSWLESAGSPHDGADDMVLAVNEAMANVVDHAYPTAQPAWSTAARPTAADRTVPTQNGRRRSSRRAELCLRQRTHVESVARRSL